MGRSDYDDTSAYGYTPTAWVSLLLTILFSVTGIIHIIQGTYHEYWIIFPTIVIGAALEVIGWSARYWSSQNVLYDPPFLQQIITLIIAPMFISAYLYTLLGIAIQRLGPEYSFFRPKTYIKLFVICDVVSLVLQAIGGGWAASVSEPPSTATNLMVGGIIFQLFSMILFSYLAGDFLFRTTRNRPYIGRQSIVDTVQLKSRERGKDEESWIPISSPPPTSTVNVNLNVERQDIRSWKWMMFGICLASIMIIIRGVYRSVELVQGWNGYLINHEVYQDTLDGIPMLLAFISLNIFHPGFFLLKRGSWWGA